MHYLAENTIFPDNTLSNPAINNIHMGAGIIKRVTIVFPPGCVRLVSVQIWRGTEQLFPTLTGTAYAEDDQDIEFSCYIPLLSNDNVITVVGWANGCSYKHKVNVMLEVSDPDEPELATVLYKLGEMLVLFMDFLKRNW